MSAKRPETPSDSQPDGPSATPLIAIDPAIIEEIRGDLRALREAVSGNALGNPGLISRVLSLEESNRNHTQKFILWGGIVTGVGIGLQYVKSIFK